METEKIMAAILRTQERSTAFAEQTTTAITVLKDMVLVNQHIAHIALHLAVHESRDPAAARLKLKGQIAALELTEAQNELMAPWLSALSQSPQEDA